MSFPGDDEIFFLDDEFLLTLNFCYERLCEVWRKMCRMRSKTSGTSLSHLEGYTLPSGVSDGVTEIILEVAPGSSLRMQHGVDFVSVGVPPDKVGNRMIEDGVSISNPPQALEVSLFGETGDAPLHPLAGQDNTKTLYSITELVSFLDKLADVRHDDLH